jgi:hypothetical protein
LTGFTARRDRNAAHFAATVKNAGQSYLRPTVHLTVVSGNTIARSIDIPFNAILPGDDRAIHAEVDRLHAGAYRAELTIDYGGDSIIEGETHVTIQ